MTFSTVGGTSAPRAGSTPVTKVNGSDSSVTRSFPATMSRSVTAWTSAAYSWFPALTIFGWRGSETSSTTTPPVVAATNSRSPASRRRYARPGWVLVDGSRIRRSLASNSFDSVPSNGTVAATLGCAASETSTNTSP